VTENVREHLERILASYEDINVRFSGIGGIGKLLGLFEDVKRELERVSDQELERVTDEIRQVVEGLLKVDYELRSRPRGGQVSCEGKQQTGSGAERAADRC
jgi:hypothetical protein